MYSQAKEPTVRRLLIQLNARSRLTTCILTRAANTNWFDEVSRKAPIQNYQIETTGGSETGRYALSVGYFNQQETVRDISFDRYFIRANTDFNVKKRIRIGENLTVAYGSRKGGFSNNEEQNAVSGSYKHHPLLPVYDIRLVAMVKKCIFCI